LLLAKSCFIQLIFLNTYPNIWIFAHPIHFSPNQVSENKKNLPVKIIHFSTPLKYSAEHFDPVSAQAVTSWRDGIYFAAYKRFTMT